MMEEKFGKKKKRGEKRCKESIGVKLERELSKRIINRKECE